MIITKHPTYTFEELFGLIMDSDPGELLVAAQHTRDEHNRYTPTETAILANAVTLRREFLQIKYGIKAEPPNY